MPRETSGFGFVFKTEHLFINVPAGAGQANSVLSLPRGFGCTIISAKITTALAATGAGATRVLNIRKGSATGTIVAAATYTLAGGATVGVVQDVPVTAANADFLDADNLTVEWPTAGAVAFTAGQIMLSITTRQRTQVRN